MHDNDGVKKAVDGTGHGDGIAVPKSDTIKDKWGNW
jgi:hypothetical protein